MRLILLIPMVSIWFSACSSLPRGGPGCVRADGHREQICVAFNVTRIETP